MEFCRQCCGQLGFVSTESLTRWPRAHLGAVPPQGWRQSAWADLVSLTWHFQLAPQVGKESHGQGKGAGS